MVVLVETPAEDVSLDPLAIGRLAKLGITNLALVRDQRTVGIVLEGWAFEPAASADAALASVAVDTANARVLLPLGEMAVSAAAEGLGPDAK